MARLACAVALLLLVMLPHAAVASAIAPVLTRPLRVAVVAIPLYGHYMPLKAVAENLMRLGHNATVFVENPAWCHTSAEEVPGELGCVVMPRSNTWDKSVFEQVSADDDLGKSFQVMFEQMTKHQRVTLASYMKAFAEQHAAAPFDAVLTDLSTFVGFDLAAHHRLPYVSMFPLTMHMTLGSTWLPSLGTGFPRDMSFPQRMINFIIKLLVPVHGIWMVKALNEVRAAHGIAMPYRNMLDVAGMYGPILAPTVWGYDIPQPLCPNIFPLGTITPSFDFAPLEDDINTMLHRETCMLRGAVYVNFGTLAVVSDRLFAELVTALVELSDYCVVWKVASGSAHETMLNDRIAAYAAQARFAVRNRFNNPPAIMAHNATRSFITHCGDTSVGEAMEAHLPLVGIPIFADQADVCQRLHESRIGIYAGHKASVVAADVVKALRRTMLPPKANTFRKALFKLDPMRRYLGGAMRGAAIVEQYVETNVTADVSLTSCRHLRPDLLGAYRDDGTVDDSLGTALLLVARTQNWDVLVFCGIVPVLLAWWSVKLIIRLCMRFGKRRLGRKAKTE